MHTNIKQSGVSMHGFVFETSPVNAIYFAGHSTKAKDPQSIYVVNAWENKILKFSINSLAMSIALSL